MKDSQVLDSGVVVEGAAAGAVFCVADGLAGALTTATLGTTVLIEGVAELASARATTAVLVLDRRLARVGVIFELGRDSWEGATQLGVYAETKNEGHDEGRGIW